MSTKTAEDTSVTGKKSIIVIFTEQQWRAAETHGISLKEDGELVHLHKCKDIHAFQDVDTEKYSRLDILVDTQMCAILILEEDLHEKAKAKFKEIDKKRGEINLINCLAQDFDLLFFQLPRNVRKVIEHGGGVPKREFVISSTGMTGDSRSAGSVVSATVDGQQRNVIINFNELLGSYGVQARDKQLHLIRNESPKPVDTANNDPPVVDMICHVPKEKEDQIFSMFTENKENIEQKAEGVIDTEINHGSVVLTLIMTKGHIVTEKWVHDVLFMLYEDILRTCLSDGEKFDVVVQRRVQYSFVIPPDPKLHENCIPKIEHETQVQELIDEQKQKNALDSGIHEHCVSLSQFEVLQRKYDNLKQEVDNKSAGRSSETLVQVGYKNKATINPTSKQAVLVYQKGRNSILNIVTQNEQSQLKISTSTHPQRSDVEDKIIAVMIKQTEDKQTVIPRVSSCAIERGSNVIKLDLEPDQIVTEQWLTTVVNMKKGVNHVSRFTRYGCNLRDEFHLATEYIAFSKHCSKLWFISWDRSFDSDLKYSWNILCLGRCI